MAQQLKFILTRDEAASIGIFTPEDFPKLREDAKILARAPNSGVQDVVIALATSDRIFIGVKVEFKGVYHSISAFQFLAANLALNFEQYAPKSLFPSSSELELPFLLMPRQINKRLALSDPVSAADICLKCRALTAANISYERSSMWPSGVALLCEGKVYHGWYINSADYELYVGALEAALVDFVARGEGKGFEKIVGAVLVEMNDSELSQEASARFLLEKIAPGCEFTVLHCYKTQEN